MGSVAGGWGVAFSLMAWQEKMRGGVASSLSPTEFRISRGREPGLGEDEPITEQGRVAALLVCCPWRERGPLPFRGAQGHGGSGIPAAVRYLETQRALGQHCLSHT